MGRFFSPSDIAIQGGASWCPPHAALGWDSVNYPVVLGYKLTGGVRKGVYTGYSPWTSASYQSCVAGAELFFDASGSNGSGTGLAGAPYFDIDKCVQAANAGGVPRTIVVRADRTIGRSQMVWITPNTVPIRIVARNGIVPWGPWDTGYVWTSAAGDTPSYPTLYRTARSAVGNVVDMSRVDRFGAPEKYINAASLVACSLRPGSRWNDGATEYIFTRDGSAPTDLTARLLLAVSSWNVSSGYTSPQDIFIEGETEADGFECLGAGFNFTPTAYASASRLLAIRRCTIKHAQRGAAANVTKGIAVDNWRGLVWLEDNVILNSGSDGGNIHNNLNSQPCFVVAVNNRIKNSGVLGQASENNFTIHENVIGYGAGNVYDTSGGRNIGNIGTTKHQEHGSRIANDRGDKIYAGAATLQPQEIGLLDSAQVWLSECEVEATNGGYAFYNPTGTHIYTKNMASVIGKKLNADEAWAS